MLPWNRSKKKDHTAAPGEEYRGSINEESLLKSLTFRKAADHPVNKPHGKERARQHQSRHQSRREREHHYRDDQSVRSESQMFSSALKGRLQHVEEEGSYISHEMEDYESHAQSHAGSHAHSHAQSHAGSHTHSYAQSHMGSHAHAQVSYHSSHSNPALLKILDNLNISIFPKENRLSSIAEALLEFDHKDKDQHDIELKAGAANILFQKLAFAVQISPQSSTHKNNIVDSTQSYLKNVARYSDADHEIAMICTALEMVYRASDAAIKRSYEEIGEEILPLIIEVINRPLPKLQVEPHSKQHTGVNAQYLMNGSSDPSKIISKDQKVAVQKITKVLAAFSLIPSAKYEMAHAPNLVPSLVRIIDTTGNDRMLPNEMGFSGGSNGIRMNSAGAGLLMTEATRFNAIAIITNLAHADGNKMYMIAQPGLVEHVSRVASSDHNDVARRCASLAIMNLSNGDDNNIPDMTGNEYILDSLCRLMKDDAPETRRNAAVSLYNIACSDTNADLLARHGDGMIVESLVEIVSGTGENTALWNDKIRSSAAETLFNMSCSKNKVTTVRMANHPSLLEGLSTALKSNNANLDVKMFCAATIRRMAEIIEHPMLCLGALFSALVKGQTWTKTDCIAQGFVVQAMNVEHRKMMVYHHGLLTALSYLAMAQGNENAKIRASAISAIGMLTTEEETRPMMAKHEGIMMALTRASYHMHGKEENNEDDDGDYFDPATVDLVKSALKNLVAVM